MVSKCLKCLLILGTRYQGTYDVMVQQDNTFLEELRGGWRVWITQIGLFQNKTLLDEDLASTLCMKETRLKTKQV